MKNFIACFFLSFYYIGILPASTPSDSILLALEDTLRMQVDSLDIAETLCKMGQQHEKLGNYDKSLKLHWEAIEIKIYKLNENHPEVAAIYHDLAYIYGILGNFEEALKLHKKSLRIRIDKLGKDHYQVGNSYNNMGIIHDLMGNYEKALKLYEKAFKIWRIQLGENHHYLYYSHNNIAIIHSRLGSIKKSLELYRKAIKVWSSKFGGNHPNIATCYNNMGESYHDLGEYNKALNLYKKALKIFIDESGEKYFEVPITYINMALAYEAEGEYDKALEMNKEAKRVWADQFGEYHFYIAEAYYNMASIMYKLKKYDKAIKLNKKSLKIRIDKLGENHPDAIKSYINLAIIYQAQNKRDSALYIWDTVIKSNLKRLNDTYLFLPDNQRLEYTKTFKDVHNNFYSFAAKYGDDNTKKLAAHLLLNTKSLALDYSISVRKLINDINDEQLNNLYNELNTLNGNISQAELMTAEELNEKNWNLADLRNQQEGLTQQLLANKTLREKLYKTSVKWKDVQSQLKSNEVMLDFIHFYEESDSTWLYYAMLTHEGMPAPQFIRITDQESIESLLQTNKITGRPNYIGNDENLQALYQKVWQPLESHLENVEAIHLSPSGLLHQIDFEALQNENGSYLASQFEFHYYTTMRDFAQRKQTNWLSEILSWLSEIFDSKKYKDLLLFGDIAYNPPTHTTAIAQLRAGLDPLSKTRDEIDEIYQINKEEGGTSIKMTGSNATEDTLKYHAEKSSPDIIHFATHGIYLAHLDTTATNIEHRLYTTGNPLQRSIIALSGANETWTSKEYISRSDNDGILTAYEVSHLDLSDIKLVVLSACETGLGDIHDTEGVLGLQSAFKLAGVEHVVVSLWKVNDEATKELMIAFYENLLIEKQDAPTAFRKAKAQMRQSTDNLNWAGFILIE